MRGTAILTLKVLLPVCFGEFFDLCDDGMLYYETSNSCYWLTETKDEYNKTLEACEKKSGSLAIIDSSSEMEFLEENLDMNYIFLWVGLVYTKNDNKFYWVNGTELHKDHFTHLLDAKPVDGQNCVVIKDHLWQASRCSKKHSGICHIRNVDLCKKDNGGCEQWCVTSGTLNRTCGCDKIYTVFGTNCLGQCERANGGCEQICTNKGQDRECSCRRGYDQDGVKCLRNFQTRILGAIIAGIIFGSLVICLCLLFLSWALSFDDGASDKDSVKKESLDKSSDTAEHAGDVDELSDPEITSAMDTPTENLKERGSTIL